ncbi:sigma-70 family RNA polymerase sigma factor, partial [Actinoplanes sp. NPDC051633]|uniref:sigma-70 family RNA polymerase sigma factor n=1 Tax=Actinoplanes sp. NPDC051633 TaxID=3155670 RepID=UPI003416AB2D
GLCMIARRRAIDWVRRSHARERTTAAGAEPAAESFEDELLDSTAHKQVRKAVTDLPALHRQAIELAYYDGLTYRQVARSLNITEGTAKWRMRSALRRIGEQLIAEGFE